MASIINAATSGGLISTGDTSGQLQLQTAGTTALTVTSAQNVGVGTSSPSNKVTVSTSGSYDGIAVNNSSTTTATRIVMNNNTSQYLQLDVGSSGRSSYGPSGPNVVSITSGASGGFNIGTDDANPLAFYTNLNERMRITSAGYVTTPYQPAFQVYGTNLTGTTYLGGTTALNVGSFFNTSTGIFTAPVAGNYLFSFSLSTSDTNSQFINIAKNGSLYAGNMLQYTTAFLTGSQTLIIPLAANDTVNAAVRDASYAIYNARFCGYLLG